MFEGLDFPKILDEERFAEWLEKGRQSKISYRYLLIIWNALESDYQPVFAEERDEIDKYEEYQTSTGHESLVAAYDLFSESRVN